MRWTRLVSLAALAAALWSPTLSRAEDAKPPAPPAGAPPAAAAPAPVVPGPQIAIPRASGLALDGVPKEDAWKTAATIPCDEREGVRPVVRLLASAARLWISAEVSEDPGEFVGLHGFLAPEGTKSLADAIQVSFTPQGPRSSRIDARGPRAVGREAYRYRAAADLTQSGRWTAEASIPFADLGLPSDTTSLRVGLAVSLRKPNLFAAAPPAAAFSSLEALALAKPPEGGWVAGESLGDAEAEKKERAAIAAEDLADRTRVLEWNQFRNAAQSGLAGGADGIDKLLGHLDAAIAARPDLAFLRRVKAKVLLEADPRPDARARARAALADAVAAVPGLPEPRWDLARIDVADWTEPPETQPSDYDAAFAKVAEAAKSRPADDPAITLATAILRHRHGDFAEAQPLFAKVVGKVPIGDETGAMSLANERYTGNFAMEMGFRLRDEKASLPRARLKTSKGDFVVELFEDDAPNTVRNFVWLARAKFYDGTKFHRVIPFFMAQGGDPLSKTGDPKVGQGGPGYAIPTEIGKPPRLPFRGVIAMANSGKDTEGSQFFVTTGTSAHLEGKHCVFGRVVEGQDVVDKIVKGDTLESVVVERARDHEYRPTTVSGKLAPDPKPSGPPEPPPMSPSANPHILIDHILIGVKNPRFPQGKRDAVAAKAFADDLVAKIKAGGDWDALKKEHSEDGSPGRPGGPYAMADRGVQPTNASEFPRDQMVPAFGDVGFALAVGEIGVAAFDPQTSPFGYHIIKRVK